MIQVSSFDELPLNSQAFHIPTALTACNLDKFYVQSLSSQTEHLHNPLRKSFRLFWTMLPTWVVVLGVPVVLASDSFAQAVAELRARNPLSRKLYGKNLREKKASQSPMTPQNLPSLELVHQKPCHNSPKLSKTTIDEEVLLHLEL